MECSAEHSTSWSGFLDTAQKAPGGQEAYKKNRNKSGDLFFFFFFFLETVKKFVGAAKMGRGAPNGNVTPLHKSSIF